MQRVLQLSIATLLAFACPDGLSAGEATGSVEADGESIAMPHVTVHEQEHPWEEGQTVVLVTLSEQEIPYLEVDDMCPGEFGNRSVQFTVDDAGETQMTNYCFQSGNSSGQTFEVAFTTFGPEEYAGTVSADFEVFDSAVSFHFDFAATLPSELPGEVLPAGGGEAGAAYLAWSEALAGDDTDLILSLLPAEQAEMFRSMPEEEQQENLEFLRLMAPTAVEVTGGRRVGDVAYLDVSATMEGEPVTGEIKLELLDGVWVAVKESW